MNECKHERLTVWAKLYPATIDTPPEIEIRRSICRDCGELVEWDEQEDVDWEYV